MLGFAVSILSLLYVGLPTYANDPSIKVEELENSVFPPAGRFMLFVHPRCPGCGSFMNQLATITTAAGTKHSVELVDTSQAGGFQIARQHGVDTLPMLIGVDGTSKFLTLKGDQVIRSFLGRYESKHDNRRRVQQQGDFRGLKP
jgi:thioredoxin-like negative regulator of GroEL